MNRRGFLRNTVAAVPAAGLALTPVVAPASTPPENLDLLRLAPELEAAEAAYAGAIERKRHAAIVYGQIAPEPPAEIVVRRGDPCYSCGFDEVDLEGREIFVGPDGTRRRIIAPGWLDDVEDPDERTLLRSRLAHAFEDAKHQAREAAGYEQALRDISGAMAAVDRVALCIFETEAMTFEGLALKARALLAVARFDNASAGRAAFMWGRPLAEAAIRLQFGGLATV